ncbi:MarR family winged helix-turn-helix transcriptional regulator [Periweissella beninensis]|uniref:MarR family transcriptional regulator n=1 Tax=Periweissella beninensis TaxID=504936 RepID=A0ABT0VLP4_9LACO|nr:MarR family transcriptional regulator [Periweissella beninensis]MBM7544554.1 DNA-binding MarR family transcriptional regulator [Periweissella beninensis]MCM2438053.1 MarR family transcriptional regulator [Periweissella beninensis]MCT4395832.1 MarR family transcriptional regulator [Periweissella beninensis]
MKSELLEKYIDVYLAYVKYLDDVIAQPAAKYKLSFEQYLILRDVAQRETLTLTDIVDERNVTRAAISRQIKMLLKRNYIYQEPDIKDRRRMLLHLTPDGKEAERIISRKVRDRFNGWIDIFGSEKAEDILRFIQDFGEVVHQENLDQESKK